MIKHEQAVKKLMLIELFNETLRQVNVLIRLTHNSLAFLNFRLFVVHDFPQNKPKAIFAFITLISADVLVLVVSEMRQQACDENSEELIAFLNRVSFQVERAEFL